MTSLESLLSEIEGGLVECLVLSDGKTCDDVLSEWDKYADRWATLSRKVETRKSAAPIVPAVDELITRIREAVFLKAFARWKSSDMAAYISDDFGLVAEAIACGVDEPRIHGLLGSYRGGTIPVDLP